MSNASEKLKVSGKKCVEKFLLTSDYQDERDHCGKVIFF